MITGEGLAQALSGVERIVDAATGPSPDQQEATEFFTTAAANLRAVGQRAGVRAIIAVSIIGCDRFAAGAASGPGRGGGTAAGYNSLRL